MRMVARIDEVEPGIFEARYSLQPHNPLTMTSKQEKRFASNAEARSWVEQQGALHSLAAGLIWWEPQV